MPSDYLLKLKKSGFIRKIDENTGVQKSALVKSKWAKGFRTLDASDQVFSILPFVTYETVTERGDAYSNYFPSELSEKILHIFEHQNKIVNELKDYFGDIEFGVDDVYIWKKSNVPHNADASESWHDDNVGHRLKIFVPFYLNSGQHVFTSIISGTNQRLYFPRFISYLRYKFPKLQDLIVKLWFFSRIQKYYFKVGQVCILDTHSIHKGNYGGDFHREMVVFEVSQKYKSLVLQKYGFPIGKCQHPRKPNKTLLKMIDDLNACCLKS